MAKSTEITASLEGLGLGANEAAVYIAMLSLGPATVLSISRASGVKRTTIYNVLESLKQKGLVRTDVRGFKQLYAAEHPKKLESMLEQRRGALLDLLPELEAQFDLKRGESFIKYYEGVGAIRNAYFEMLEGLNHDDEFLVVGDPDRWEDMNGSFATEFIRERNRKKLRIRMMLVDSSTARRYKEHETNFQETIKMLPADSKVDTNLVVTPRKVIIQQMLKPSILVSIENKSIITMHTELFNVMWRNL
ncbi:MAG TPA: helix-turn-helix domain-containing protein [Candidatus Paceibacterota bacterium]|nr:helix-turn-helix domain-containing protein [Candidatus Paceibacterota bacterium]